MTITKKVRKQRQSGIGGSDTAGILNQSPHNTPLSIYDSKVHDLEPETDPDRFWFGNACEKIVAQRIRHDLRKAGELKGKRLYEPPGMMWHPNGVMFGNPDRVLVDKATGKWLAGYECKWIDGANRKEWSAENDTKVELPMHYYVQAFHYLMVARACGHDLDRWWVVVVFGGNDPRYYPVEWNQTRADAIEARVLGFWRDYVVPKKRPPHGGHPADTKTLNRMFNKEMEQALEATNATEKRVERYHEIQTELRQLNKEKDHIRNDLRVIMGSATRLVGMSWAASFKKQRAKRRTNYQAIFDEYGITERDLERFQVEEKAARRLTIHFKKRKDSNG